MVDSTDESGRVRTSLYIDGEARWTSDVLEIVDPAKPESIVGAAAAASPDDVADAVEAALRAYVDWSAQPTSERAAALGAAIEGVADERDTDAAVLSQENGKIVSEAWVDALVFEIRWNLALSLADQVDARETLDPVPGMIATRTEIRHQPLGVVTIIVPFNWPIAILGAALPHALLAGNTVVVKPPPSAPLATTRLVQRVAEKLPPGVLNIVTGRDEAMSGLIDNPSVAKVCFTGSVGGGKKIMEMAAHSLTRVTLELGGNDAAILLEDVALDDVHLDRLFASIFDTTGQICMNAKRVFVHRSRLNELIAGLEERLERVVLGHGLSEGTTMGPLHQKSQKAYVESLVREAKESGADVREFGDLPGEELSNGYFVRPALVIDPDRNLRVVTEEQFGPVIPIVPFDHEAEALAWANDTWAGLGGSVWTEDSETAARVAGQLVCGYVWINDHGATRLDLRAPFGGMRQSGMGREQGLAGIRDFQDTRSVAVLAE